jgi:glycosyltransferase involved in cell wall biosynthesis
MPDAQDATPAWRREGDLVFAFFGQISRLKGIDLLFDAAEILARRKVEGVRIEVHGDASGQPPEFREAFEARLARLPPLIEIRGRYDNARVRGLMAATDAVLVPSLWWENSPLVIQEALAARRPVICSDIGGMAEKVRDGVDGFHFRAGSAAALAALMAGLAAAPRKLRDLQDGLAVPRSLAETTRETLLLYRRLLRVTGAPAEREEMLA